MPPVYLLIRPREEAVFSVVFWVAAAVEEDS